MNRAPAVERLAHLRHGVALDLDRQPGRAPRPAAPAAAPPTAAARTASHRRGDPARRRDVVVLDQRRVPEAHPVVLAAAAPHRVLLQHPQPGVVFRVSRTAAPVPAIASAQARVAVAIPDRWVRKLSMVRSAPSTAGRGPLTRSTASPGPDPRPVRDQHGAATQLAAPRPRPAPSAGHRQPRPGPRVPTARARVPSPPRTRRSGRAPRAPPAPRPALPPRAPPRPRSPSAPPPSPPTSRRARTEVLVKRRPHHPHDVLGVKPGCPYRRQRPRPLGRGHVLETNLTRHNSSSFTTSSPPSQ